MTPNSPPIWLQRSLSLLLNSRDRETISGDLLEEYRDEKLPRLGPLAANLWYLRQVMSFASSRLLDGSLAKLTLTTLCTFASVAGAWLFAMENILQHAGHGTRSLIAAGIVLQALWTLFYLLVGRPSLLRHFLLIGSAGILWVGASSLSRTFQPQHFEGFALIISLALIAQGILTIATLRPAKSLFSRKAQ